MPPTMCHHGCYDASTCYACIQDRHNAGLYYDPRRAGYYNPMNTYEHFSSFPLEEFNEIAGNDYIAGTIVIKPNKPKHNELLLLLPR